MNEKIDILGEIEESLRTPTGTICDLNEDFTVKNETGILVMMGPSGCSKTRTAYEALSTKIGLYFTATVGRKFHSITIKHSFNKEETVAQRIWNTW